MMFYLYSIPLLCRGYTGGGIYEHLYVVRISTLSIYDTLLSLSIVYTNDCYQYTLYIYYI